MIPKHIGYIVDGNRRWAKQHKLSAYEGHLAGYDTIQKVIMATFGAGIKFVSIYVFSTENWTRSKGEINKIMELVFKLLTSDLPIFEDKNIKLKILGSRDRLSKNILKAISNAEARTANNKVGTLAVCLNYGGQTEIVDAVKEIIRSGFSPDDINIELIEQNLYAPEIPPIDIIIRTSGEQRLSNFMLWRAAYSEIMFIDKMWPDMTKDDVADIIKEYSKRSRRFGG